MIKSSNNLSKSVLKSLISLASLFIINFSFGQQTEYYHEPDRLFKEAMELFTKEKYSAASESFEKFLNVKSPSSVNVANAKYYRAVCAYELFHPDAENLFSDYLNENPEGIKTGIAHFYLARINYRQKKYGSALANFEKTDIYYLNNEEIAEYYFKSGYCYFMKADFEKAGKNFNEIVKVESRYQTAAQYYYAHIAYANNNYSTALSNFQKLKDSETFGSMVPYYITQIYFEQANYNELINYAQPIADKAEVENSVEITRIVAESFYRKGDYQNALSYFEKYKTNIPSINREDNYSIAFCLYKTGEYAKAIEHFQQVVNAEDSVAQNAYYHLADCFIKVNNKQSARNAFQYASKYNYDNGIKEKSLLNYAKLSYELNFQPVAINAFRDFIAKYPASASIDEANEWLAQLYLTTRNYKDAIAALENIKTRSANARAAYQKVTYYRGVEFYNDGDKDKAINLFEKAIVTDVDPVLRAQAMYWKAEALYAQNKFDAAIKQYRIYIFNSGSVNTPMYNLANYNMGYCYFKQNNYSESQTWFRKYIKNKNESTKDKFDDANIRAGDCFYAMRDFYNAADYYNAAINNSANSSDYALFQTGIIQGLQNNLSGKASTMETLMTRYGKSKYKPDAMYEAGRAAMAMNENEKAKQYFNRLTKEYPSSTYNSKALLNTALIQYNDKQDDAALQTYKQVIEKYPGSNEATEALTGVKNIYVSSGTPNEYFTYIKTVSNTSVSAGAQDSITYEAAEQRYLKGNFTEAAVDFNNYLTQFGDGAFRMNATFYKSECDYRNKNYATALIGYEDIISKPKNIYTEKSLAKAGHIQFKNANYEQAITHFKKLEETADLLDNILSAQSGLMRSYHITNQHEQAITYAQKLISSDKVSKELAGEAHLVYGRSALVTGDLTAAQREFAIVAKQSGEQGAEGRYNVAFIHYQLQNFKTSKDKCFEVINAVPSYDYWIAKSFVLLADNYVALADTFQAVHTLKSIIDNYEKSPSDKDDVRASAIEKLNSLQEKQRLINEGKIEEKEKVEDVTNTTNE